MRSVVTIFCLLFSFVNFSLGCGRERQCSPDTQIPYTTCDEDYMRQKRCPPDTSLRIITGHDDDTCICKEGFFWKDEDTCVPLEDCCDGNRTASQMFRTCERICPTYPPIPICLEFNDRKNYHCNCRDGYVLNYDKECIHPLDCERCRPNEYYYECLNVCAERTCATKNDTLICPKVCPGPGCACKPDHARHINGRCIPIEACPKCGDHEEYDIFPSDVTVECDDENIDRNLLKAGCICVDGYTRNSAGFCVPYDDSDLPYDEDDDDITDNGNGMHSLCPRGYYHVGDSCVRYRSKNYEHGRCFTKYIKKLRMLK